MLLIYASQTELCEIVRLYQVEPNDLHLFNCVASEVSSVLAPFYSSRFCQLFQVTEEWDKISNRPKTNGLLM